MKTPAVLALVCLVLFVALRSVAAPVGLGLEAGRALPAAPIGYVDSGSVSCTQAAAVRLPVNCGQVSIEVVNTGTTRVAIGDSGISDPGASGNSDSATVCASGSGCSHNNVWSGNVRNLWCRGDTDTTVSYRDRKSVV